MRKTPLAKKGKQKISVIQRELWKLTRPLVFHFYGRDCYTCPAKNLQGSNCQVGHVPWPKASLGAYLRYDLRCLRPQCMRCNIHMGGQGAEAYKKMLRLEGEHYMAELEKDRQKTVKALDHYLSLTEEYKSLATEEGLI